MALLCLKNSTSNWEIQLYGESVEGILDIYTLKLNTDSKAYKELTAEKIPTKNLIYYSLSDWLCEKPLSYLAGNKKVLNEKDFVVKEDDLIGKGLKFGTAYELFPDPSKEPVFRNDPRVPRDERRPEQFLCDPEVGSPFILERNNGTKEFYVVLTDYVGLSECRVMRITEGDFLLNQASSGCFEALPVANPTEEKLDLVAASFDLVKDPETINLGELEHMELAFMTTEDKKRREGKNGEIRTTAKVLHRLAKKQNFFAQKIKERM